MTRSALASSRGQSSIELLGLLPLLAAVTLGLAELLAAGLAHSAASSAAEAAAMAIVAGTDPTIAARAAAPAWSRSRMTVSIHGRHVTIHITPPGLLPGTSQLLATTADADAGPAPSASAPTPAPSSDPTRAGRPA
jgi:Flp pilus assembly protein TadG